ncbi:MAG: glycosyltransferase, partial [Henriciella sp.]|nr:glycosyltransferase [Henriciella sp.]
MTEYTSEHLAGADGYSGADRSGLRDLDVVQVDPTLLEPQTDSLTSVFEPPAEYLSVVLDPVLSCLGGLWPKQRLVLNLGLGGLGIIGLFVPTIMLVTALAVLWSAFACLIVWRLILIVLGTGMRLAFRGARGNVLSFDRPGYSVLVPVYRETEMMTQLAGALSQIIWPDDRLDIQILFEADDTETLAAADITWFPRGTRFTIVPEGGVRTKPNALNYGLTWALGDYVCIFDAEDRPHPGQLLEAYRAFQAGGDDLACVQAPLVADNGHEALIAAHWKLDYATQFGLLMPAIEILGLPIPIGGTSNHFRKQDLLMAGGWDAWNVTEDADLGLRLARLGRRVGMLNLPTFEDAPTGFGVWTAQRSRWIKGFMQTWRVHMRHYKTAPDGGHFPPARRIKNLFSLQITVGATLLLAYLHVPSLLIMTVFYIASPTGAYSLLHPLMVLTV